MTRPSGSPGTRSLSSESESVAQNGEEYSMEIPLFHYWTSELLRVAGKYNYPEVLLRNFIELP